MAYRVTFVLPWMSIGFTLATDPRLEDLQYNPLTAMMTMTITSSLPAAPLIAMGESRLAYILYQLKRSPCVSMATGGVR